MLNNHLISTRKAVWPWLVILVILTFTAFLLHFQGRLWWCACGQLYLWVGDIWSSDNSQHLLDPYTFSHVLHGFVFFWVLVWLLPRVSLMWRLVIAVAIEAGWELIENSAFIIQRYREATLAIGYTGDTIVNSISDILACAFGFMLAYYLGFRRALILFVLIEIVMIFWIRDSLILNVIMLIYPIEPIRAWQVGN